MIDGTGQSVGTSGRHLAGARSAAWGVAPPRQAEPRLFGGWGPRL